MKPEASAPTTLRAAVVQASPAVLEPERGARAVGEWILRAADHGARLVVFPEALIPGYPRDMTFGTVIGNRSDDGRRAFARYWSAAVDVPGPITTIIGHAAKKAGCWVALGLVERASRSPNGGTLYCSIVYFTPGGEIAGVHRKLKPTAAERIVWGEGDGSTLTVVRTPFGGLGGLICWENLMPLARAALWQQGVDLWVAPTADARESWQVIARYIALEGRCFVLSANQFVTRDMMPEDWEPVAGPGDVLCRGGSVIVDPMGEVLAGPLWDREDLLLADLCLERIAEARMDFDVVGHYARPDILRPR